jgi:starch phosphorylase
MKKCIQSLGPVFNTNRMVHEYTDLFYVNAHKRATSLSADNFAKARALASDIDNYRRAWPSIKIESVLAETLRPVPVRTPLPIQAVVQLGDLAPDKINVQVYSGSVAAEGNITDGIATDMHHVEDLGHGRHRFAVEIIAQQSGRRGFAVRILPRHPSLASPIIPGLITWDTATGNAPTANPTEQPENATA